MLSHYSVTPVFSPVFYHFSVLNLFSFSSQLCWCGVVPLQCDTSVGPIIEPTASVAAADTDVSDDSHDETKYFNDDNWHDDDDDDAEK